MQIETPSPTGQQRYANVWLRLLALVLDFLVLSLVFFPVTKAVKGVWIMGSGEHLWSYGWFITDPLCMSFLVVIVLYFVLLEGICGATIGKMLLGLKVIRVDGERAGLARSLLRNLLRVVDSLPAFNILGVILILTSSERARFGDRVAGTRVIVRRDRRTGRV